MLVGSNPKLPSPPQTYIWVQYPSIPDTGMSWIPISLQSPRPAAAIAIGAHYKPPTAGPHGNFCSEDNYKPDKASQGLLQFSAQHIKLKMWFQFTIIHQAENHHGSIAGTRVAISMMEAGGEKAPSSHPRALIPNTGCVSCTAELGLTSCYSIQVLH